VIDYSFVSMGVGIFGFDKLNLTPLTTQCDVEIRFDNQAIYKELL